MHSFALARYPLVAGFSHNSKEDGNATLLLTTYYRQLTLRLRQYR